MLSRHTCYRICCYLWVPRRPPTRAYTRGHTSPGKTKTVKENHQSDIFPVSLRPSMHPSQGQRSPDSLLEKSAFLSPKTISTNICRQRTCGEQQMWNRWLEKNSYPIKIIKIARQSPSWGNLLPYYPEFPTGDSGLVLFCLLQPSRPEAQTS